jgi:hypothetical protein
MNIYFQSFRTKPHIGGYRFNWILFHTIRQCKVERRMTMLRYQVEVIMKVLWVSFFKHPKMTSPRFGIIGGDMIYTYVQKLLHTISFHPFI